MENGRIEIENIPALVWGGESDRVYLYVHGKMGKKEDAGSFAEIVTAKGFQVLSFDLPEHGDRQDPTYPCTVQNGVQDLLKVLAYTQLNWSQIRLFACSLGAYFSLVAYPRFRFQQCLFLSPVLDMELLIRNMMTWFNVTEAKLRESLEIETPMGETLSWDYWQFVVAHPIAEWSSPTKILIGENDHLTERTTLKAFADRFGCTVQTIPGGGHHLSKAGEVEAISGWISRNG